MWMLIFISFGFGGNRLAIFKFIKTHVRSLECVSRENNLKIRSKSPFALPVI